MFVTVILFWTTMLLTCWVGIISRITQAKHCTSIASSLIVSFVAAIVPTIICVSTIVFLFGSHPTAQFNGGDSYRLDMWSLWLSWYPIIVCASFGIVLFDGGLLVLAIFFREIRFFVLAITSSLIASGIGLFVLAHVAPSA